MIKKVGLNLEIPGGTRDQIHNLSSLVLYKTLAYLVHW
jgi:hypothetical protein